MLQLVQRWTMNIHHVTRVISLNRDVFVQNRIESLSCKSMLDSSVWGGKVIIAGGDQDLHVRVFGHRFAQIAGRGGIAHLTLPVPSVDSFAKDVIWDVGLVP